MILAAHAITGAATALILKNHLFVGLPAALLSHFVLDAIPHWHYPIAGLKQELKNLQKLNGHLPKLNKEVIQNLATIGMDFATGIGASVLYGLQFAPTDILLILGGAVLGVIPDFLQLLYFLFPVFPLAQIQHFHLGIHSPRNLDATPPLLGITNQLLPVIICLSIIHLAFT